MTNPTHTPGERPTFPILGSRGAKIDLQLVEDHGKQAYANHYQTVTRLAERGGLSWCELHAVLHNRSWQKMDENTAIEECRALEASYLSAWNQRTVDTELLEALKEARTTISILRTNVLTEIGRCADPSESRWEGVPEQLAKRLAYIDAAITKATGHG